MVSNIRNRGSASGRWSTVTKLCPTRADSVSMTSISPPPAPTASAASIVQPPQQHGRGQQLHPGGGQFDGQRDAVESTDHCGHCRRVLGCQGEVRPHVLGAGQELSLIHI